MCTRGGMYTTHHAHVEVVLSAHLHEDVLHAAALLRVVLERQELAQDVRVVEAQLAGRLPRRRVVQVVLALAAVRRLDRVQVPARQRLERERVDGRVVLDAEGVVALLEDALDHGLLDDAVERRRVDEDVRGDLGGAPRRQELLDERRRDEARRLPRVAPALGDLVLARLALLARPRDEPEALAVLRLHVAHAARLPPALAVAALPVGPVGVPVDECA